MLVEPPAFCFTAEGRGWLQAAELARMPRLFTYIHLSIKNFFYTVLGFNPKLTLVFLCFEGKLFRII